MTFNRERLLQLLPAIYRLRDEEGDGTLAALLGILAQQAEVLGEDMAQLHDDQFIETAAEWVVPYIGDLVGARGVTSVESAAFSARAYVANTIRYRRRKGTIAVIEQLARDVTGWPASAVEYFLRLITTQNVNHVRHDPDYEVLHPGLVRLKPLATVDLRDWEAIERLDSAFETSAHTVDVRRIAPGPRRSRGRYNIPNAGIFLWRLEAYPLTESPSVKVDDQHYVIHPLGIDSPLFTRPSTETEIEHLAEPLNVPAPISRRVLDAYLSSYYSSAESDRSVRLFDDGAAIDMSKVHVCNLSDGSAAWIGAPTHAVALDPVLGRIAFNAKPDGLVAATFHYGFPADIGGGEYEREASFALGDEKVLQVPTLAFPTIAAALLEAKTQNFSKVVIEITDSGRYEETLTIELNAHQDLEIRSANGRRATLVLGGDCTIRGGAGADLHLNGLLISGGTLVVPNELTNLLAGLNVTHCTLVPGLRLQRDRTPLHPELPSLLVEERNDKLRITVRSSITGALHVSPHAISLAAYDSIIDGGPPRGGMAIMSGEHPASIDLSGIPTPAIDVTIGKTGPLEVPLAGSDLSVVDRRDELQTAIPNIDPAFAHALVLTDNVGNKVLSFFSGTSEAIAIGPHAGDAATLALLKLNAPDRRIVRPFISDRLATSTKLLSSAPKVEIRIGGGAWHELNLDVGATVSVPQLRDKLRQRINAIPGDAYGKAQVVSHDRRVIVLPGVENATVEFRAVKLDRTTALQFGLLPARPAICGPAAGTDCPPLTLERCTILGGVRAASLPYVSDTIFSAPVVARRKQTGCVRFSFVPEGSQTPRRYRCQPDLEVEEQAEKQFVAAPPTKAQLDALRAEIVRWLVPGFVSTRYGDPAYVQLTRSTPRQIRTGSEKGSEMGAYAMLEQPQREANLRAALDEYLRFGLEAGIFYAS